MSTDTLTPKTGTAKEKRDLALQRLIESKKLSARLALHRGLSLCMDAQ